MSGAGVTRALNWEAERGVQKGAQLTQVLITDCEIRHRMHRMECSCMGKSCMLTCRPCHFTQNYERCAYGLHKSAGKKIGAVRALRKYRTAGVVSSGVCCGGLLERAEGTQSHAIIHHVPMHKQGTMHEHCTKLCAAILQPMG